MTIKASTIIPGLLVSLKTSVRGNVTYRRLATTQERQTDEKTGVEIEAWETQRTVLEPKEQEDAILARTKARVAVTRVCKASTFGLLCPEADAEELEQGIAEARKVAQEFNAAAKYTRISVTVLTGRIAPNDIEAVKAINGEISELLQDMEKGVGDGDVKGIREAANKARAIAEMLSTEARVQAEIAIEAARKVARELTKAKGKAVEVDKRAQRTIASARTVFLDLDEPAEVADAPKAKAATLDLSAGE